MIQHATSTLEVGEGIDVFNDSLFISLSLLLAVSVVSGLNSSEEDVKFFELLKRAEGGPSRAGSRSKTCPEVPIVFRVSSGNPESRLSIPGARNVRGLESCSLYQDRKKSCVRQGIHLVLQVLNLSQRAD